MGSCFFIGHHDARDNVFPLLAEAVEQHITEYHVTEFYVGHYGRFDSMAAKAVMDAKKQHPEIRLTLVLPYHPAIRPMEKPKGFDDAFYPWIDERIPKRFAIVRTNRRMVDTCGFLIAYAWHHLGSSGDLVEYARRREERGLTQITNLAQRSSAI